MKAFKEYYKDLLDYEKYPIVKEHLLAFAERLLTGLKNNDTLLYTEINNYHPKYLGKSVEFLSKIKWSLDDCKFCIAKEYGFENWKAVEDLGEMLYNIPFELAVNSIIEGDLETLKDLVHQYPNLTKIHSQYGHQATLLHYTASNGVEIWRQIAPQNLPEITIFLIKNKAAKNAPMKVYNGEFSAYELLTSSAHPYEMGIGQEMEKILK